MNRAAGLCLRTLLVSALLLLGPRWAKAEPHGACHLGGACPPDASLSIGATTTYPPALSVSAPVTLTPARQCIITFTGTGTFTVTNCEVNSERPRYRTTPVEVSPEP